MKTELGYDWAFNQTTQDVRQTLKISTAAKCAPVPVEADEEGGVGRKVSHPSGPGVDIFIDSVGGVFHSMVMEQMKNCGRVCVLGKCGDPFAFAEADFTSNFKFTAILRA